MESTKTMLTTLSPQSENQTLLVRVTRIWEAINKNNGAPIYTNVILLDEKDNHMLALVRNNQKKTILPQLEEDEVYSIANIKVVPGPAKYKTADAALAINFFYRTRIQKEPDTGIIPRYKFELKEFDAVRTMVGKVELLIDVVGKVSSYGRRETRGNGAQKRDIVLHDIRKDRMVVTLWEDRAEQFMQQLSNAKGLPVFVVVTGLLAKKFSGAASLSSTDSTRCYVNIDYPPLNALRDYWLQEEGPGQELIAPIEEDFVATDGNPITELPVASILESKIPPGKDVVRFICRAKIIAILTGNGWFYSCCPKCAKSIRALDGKYYCTSCGEEPGRVEQRFRVVVQVEDKSATTTLTLFNKEAEQIVGIPLRKILSEMDEDVATSAIPPSVNNIIGKKFIFQLKITQYNMTHGCEEFTVTRVSEEPSMESPVAEASAETAENKEPGGNANKKPKVA